MSRFNRSEQTPPRLASRAAHARGRPGPALRPPAPGADRAPADEPYLDGLFTYCLSVLCQHDAAIAALGDALALAERCRARLRTPELRRAWLYALARWACLRRLSTGRPATASPDIPRSVAEERRRELATLAWPEAAGTTPQQREALELAIRHQLPPVEIAAILSTGRDAVRALLARAACEVERTRTALSVVELGSCPSVARLARDAKDLLGTTLRRELVRHVDECPACRLTAEQAVPAGPWPGTATPAVLAVVEAPRPAVLAAAQHADRALRAAARDRRPVRPDGRPRAVPYFDRRGFPLDDSDRAARRAAIRQRAMTTTVVAAVMAAPALALWAAYRDAPHTGEAQTQDTTSVSASDTEPCAPVSVGGTGDGARASAEHGRAGAPRTGGTPPSSAARPTTSPGAAPGPHPPSPSAPESPPAPGRITVTARPHASGTLITLTNEGGSPVRWTASTSAYWLRLSATSGTLRPGQSTTVTVAVDDTAEPVGAWRAQVVIGPPGSVVTLQGSGRAPSPSPPSTPPSPPAPSHSATPSPAPSRRPTPTPSPSPSAY